MTATPPRDLAGSPMFGGLLRRQRDGGGNHAGKGMDDFFGFLAKRLQFRAALGVHLDGESHVSIFDLNRANHPGGYDIDAIDGVLDTFQGLSRIWASVTCDILENSGGWAISSERLGRATGIVLNVVPCHLKVFRSFS